ncbi:hypothetical protein B0J13DRAFT_626840 [Dactylonectria estremocensis]|uniref:Uncharacterized protein n=1 Tax=Dactylonectria estremocensis TaxID=1079267 RepID=A0A9P9E012_9HYPO|nr:hypothetical protein B0J13DRAFT_626840 [Dactylonectria estremocensis]
MPVFDFKARWMDFYGNPANSSDSKDGCDDSSVTGSTPTSLAHLAVRCAATTSEELTTTSITTALASAFLISAPSTFLTTTTSASQTVPVNLSLVTPAAEAPIVSYYLRPYLGVSLGLTWLTLDLWYAYTNLLNRKGWRRSMILTLLFTIPVKLWQRLAG